MARKLFIKTFGCQMNEYDSARMADVLAVSHDLESTDDPCPGRRTAAQYLLDPRKGAGEGVLPAWDVARAEDGPA